MSSGNIFRRPPVLLALCLVSVGGVVTLVGRLATGPAVAFKQVELANEPGVKAYPAFSPDGNWLAYSARGASGGDDSFHIFVRDMIAGKSAQLTKGDSSDIGPAWSPDGSHLAFVRVGEGCVVMPAAGGEPRMLPGCTAPGDETQPSPAVSWMHDGQSLVVVHASDDQPASLARLSLADGKLRPLTHPEAGKEDSMPAVSPDGSTIAFVRSNGPERADIFLCDAAGANPRRLTFDDRPIRAISWTRDGQDLVYSGQRVRGWRLWRLPAYGGSPHDLMPASREAYDVAVAPAGNRLVYTVNPTVSSIWRSELKTGEEVEERAIISSTGNENGPRYSPDGKSVADISDQTGSDQIWLSNADGGNRVQVTNLPAASFARIRWSPDGKSLIFDAAEGQQSDLYIVPASAGAKAVRVRSDALNGSWSHDGKTIYYQADNHIWKASPDGANPEQLTNVEGAAQPVESVDAKWIYFRDGRSFWRIPAGGGEAERTIVPEHDLMWSTTMQPARQGMYYIEFARSAGQPVVSFFDYAGKKSTVVFQMKQRGGFREAITYSISPDGKYILYARVDRSQTNFLLVENFR